MKHILIIFLGAVLAIVFSRSLSALEAPPQGPVVLELFTSQSCSSCPAADKVLAEAAGLPGVIALGFHVTYWDHLSWKDTLSHEFATARQRSYAWQRDSSRVYTPQMIVNGGEEFVGSDRGRLQKSLKKSAPLASLILSRQGGEVVLTLPSLAATEYTLWLFGTKNSVIQPIRSGENGGRTVTYTHAVMLEKELGSWDGTKGQRTFAVPAGQDIDRLVVLAQSKKYGPIYGAGLLDLKDH